MHHLLNQPALGCSLKSPSLLYRPPRCMVALWEVKSCCVLSAQFIQAFPQLLPLIAFSFTALVLGALTLWRSLWNESYCREYASAVQHLCNLLLMVHRKPVGKFGCKIEHFILKKKITPNFYFNSHRASWGPYSSGNIKFLAWLRSLSLQFFVGPCSKILLRNAESLRWFICSIIQTTCGKCISFPCKFSLIQGLNLQIEANTL